MDRFGKIFPWLIVAFFALYLVSNMRPPSYDTPMQIGEFAKIPVLQGGRVKPIGTVANVSLMIVSNKTTAIRSAPRTEAEYARPWQLEAQGEEVSAVEWLLETMAAGHAFRHATTDEQARAAMARMGRFEVVRVDNRDVIEALGLPDRQRMRYSLSDFLRPVSNAGGAASVDEQGRRMTPFSLLATQAQEAHMAQQSGKELDLYQRKLLEVARRLSTLQALFTGQTPHIVPDYLIAASNDVNAKGVPADAPAPAPVAPQLDSILHAYEVRNAGEFNLQLKNYLDNVDARMPQLASRANFESFFNSFNPFIKCMALYIAVGVLVCLGWLGWTKPFHRAAIGLLVLTLIVHGLSLGARMYLMDRPLVFVTNLYSSAVFIGFGFAAIALVMERIFRNGLSTLLAAVAGFITLLIAYHLKLSEGKDQLEMMQAVLDTNFWLATHVTVVTLGYSATFFAGLLGIVFVVLGLATPILDKESMKVIGRMIYGTVAFALLLSFTGTVLGGIWADQSWGRFWGWDPKENGALMIVIWNALILHARWAGIVQFRGMAVLAIAGNIMTAWSWFGTNQLGVGLHAYGFNDTLTMWLVIFGGSQLAVIALGCLPKSLWWSFNEQTGGGNAPPPQGRPGAPAGPGGAKPALA